ncbi:MAG: PLP-dependent aminotransferase family protein [Meiothermus silvanus]|nr:PLP-dependent aminotransferase family protein [Allomeiothermus silvanus]
MLEPKSRPDLKLNRRRTQALYRQIAEQIKSRIASGELPGGTRLPPIRTLAAELGVTRLTVQNAYRELQAEGLIEATVGRGTFVGPETHPSLLHLHLGERLTPMGVLHDVHKVQQVRGVRNLALASPDPHLFPTEEFWASLEALHPQGSEVFQYGPVIGDPHLRLAISGLLAQRGLEAPAEEVLITVGGLQGLALTARVLCQPGDEVVIEQPTYLGFLNILHTLKLRPLPVPLDEQGPSLRHLEALLKKHRPRFYYTLPNFHNPTGMCFAPERRQALVDLAIRYGLTLVEDDTYAHLAYDMPPPPPLRALDRSHVLYLSSFSKVLMPGLRIGFVLAPSKLLEGLLALHSASDICGPPLLLQRATARFIQQGGLERHLRKVVPIYRERRDTLLDALRAQMPRSVRWTRPKGGFSCWLSLPAYFPPGALYQAALQRGVAITPGEAFLTQTQDHTHMRLCFGYQGSEALREGVAQLAPLVREQAARLTHIPPIAEVL